MPSQTIVQSPKALQGQILHIPDLLSIFAHWPSGLSPHLQQVRETLQDKLDQWIVDGKLLLKIQKIDIPLMISRFVLCPLLSFT